jgi:hypothetical protein
MVCPQASVRNYESTLRNIAKEWTSHLNASDTSFRKENYYTDATLGCFLRPILVKTQHFRSFPWFGRCFVQLRPRQWLEDNINMDLKKCNSVTWIDFALSQNTTCDGLLCARHWNCWFRSMLKIFWGTRWILTLLSGVRDSVLTVISTSKICDFFRSACYVMWQSRGSRCDMRLLFSSFVWNMSAHHF